MSGELAEPLVSIVIPTYFIEHQQALVAAESALSQSYCSVEVLLVGTGMGDLRFAFEGQPRIKFVETPLPLSIPMARNLGIQMSTGDWIGWLDADDELDARAVELLLDARRGSSLIMGRCLVVGPTSELLRPSPAGFLKGPSAGSGNEIDPLTRYVFALQPQLYSRPALEALGGFSESYAYAELSDLLLRYISKFRTGAIGIAEHAIYKYKRTRPNSHSRSRDLLSSYRSRAIEEYVYRQTRVHVKVVPAGWDADLQAQEFKFNRRAE